MERANDLLIDAEDFFGAANDLFVTSRWSKVCFNCQQAVELALKATLNYLGLERRGHGLSTLLDEVYNYREEFEQFKDAMKILDQYYIPTRYANAFYSGPAMKHYTKGQAEEAIKYAEDILKLVRQIVTEKETETGS
ncbi:HEPN domain-containing protein [bacterium]|nr:HEPN domain-containing protein [bacterium]